MVILHITSISDPKGNGVAVAVNNYVKYESKHATVGLYNLDGIIKNEFCQSFEKEQYGSIKDLPKPFCQPDIVIFNEVYKLEYINLYKECLNRKLKYVIIPHGCLVKLSQRKHKLKKVIGNLLLFNKFISSANAVQFLNEKERDNSIGFKYKKIIISGNGIDASIKKANKYKSNDFIYIGRYALYIKGLDMLVMICSKYHEWFKKNNIHFNLYGRDSLNGVDKLRSLISKNGVEDTIIINDAIYGQEKEKVLLNAYAFIQLSRHEGQPMGIIEALSYGLPCIVSYGTSFGEYVNNNDCGLGCLFDEKEIFSKIKEMFENKEKRNLQSKNAYACVKRDFDWKIIVSNLIKEYKEV